MVYESFLTAIKDRLQQELGDNFQIRIQKIPKNNGMILDGLCIHMSDFPMAPAIYLNAYYDQYRAGMSLDAVIQDILSLYRSTSVSAMLESADLSDPEPLRSRIMFKLIHAASNQALLQDIPHIPYLDLAIVFYLYLDHSASGQMTALIHKEHMERWHLKTGDLWSMALTNTPLCFPAEIRSMTDMLKQIAQGNPNSQYSPSSLDALLEEEEPITPLFVLTNQNSLNGACCMIYRNILKDFADSLGMDLIILPSSIHEVLITPDLPGTSYEELSNMVTTINRMEVPPEDQLSNQVYLYTREDDRIRIVSHSPLLVGCAAAS